jgi:acetyl-CoA carboxylase biotin carboxyl carrier protein
VSRIIDIPSTMTGTVWTVDVAVGDRVQENDRVITLESMKMEIPVGAPADGEIAEILVAREDHVDDGQVIARMRT